ncbi:MAG TPA: DEAD/DEAH box helicase [Chloroflexi bacterium]|nr:DEAD/DEAH box helicase [Chloroflexota bacterium]
MTDIDSVLDELRTTGAVATHVTAWHVLPARAARYGATPEALHPALVACLGAQGITQLYRHQAQAIAAALAGRHVAVCTPTASGKSLCYHLPVLDALLRDASSCALYLFPTKALGHDQLHALERWTDALGLKGVVQAYDGDTPSGRRARIREEARVIVTNPDMLHMGILPYHTRWRRLLANLRYVVIDEMHHYRGVFGSHVANVLRRLQRLCRCYGAAPRYECCSATIANPAALASRLTGQDVTLIAENGAPSGERAFVVLNPPIVDAALGLRRPALLEARALINRLLARDVQTVAFVGSRLGVELLLGYLRADAVAAGRPAEAVRGYRGGYLPALRREIEAGLRAGTVRGVVATNALELGIDIGGLDASVLVGYPGTIASTWQQAGRAGRGTRTSAAFLVASSTPLDQFIAAHPAYLLGRSPEHALINPDNLALLLAHVQCAVAELPLEDGEPFGDDSLPEILAALEEAGRVRHTRGRWHWASDLFPAAEVSLRATDPDSITIIAEDAAGGRRTIGQLDRPSAPRLVHEGAIYLHEGQQYAVESLDWEAGVAQVRPVMVDYYTEASHSTRITIERTLTKRHHTTYDLAVGEVLLTTRATGYRRWRLGSLEHLGWGDIDLPEQTLLTWACWLTIPQAVVERLRAAGLWTGVHVASRGPNWARQRDLARRRDGYKCQWCGAPERPGRQHHVHHIVPFREFGWSPGANEAYVQANRLSNLITLCPNCHRRAEEGVAVQSTLAGLGRVLGHLVPLYLMCDARDVGIVTDVQAEQTGLPTAFFVDRVPAGIGLSEQVMALFTPLVRSAAELVRDCPCRAGCPSCIGPGGEPEAKRQVLHLAEVLQEP